MIEGPCKCVVIDRHWLNQQITTLQPSPRPSMQKTGFETSMSCIFLFWTLEGEMQRLECFTTSRAPITTLFHCIISET